MSVSFQSAERWRSAGRLERWVSCPSRREDQEGRTRRFENSVKRYTLDALEVKKELTLLTRGGYCAAPKA